MKYNELSVKDQELLFKSFFGMWLGSASDAGLNENNFLQIKEISREVFEELIVGESELIYSFIEDSFINDVEKQFTNKIIEELFTLLGNSNSVDDYFNKINLEEVKQIITGKEWDSLLYICSQVESRIKERL